MFKFYSISYVFIYILDILNPYSESDPRKSKFTESLFLLSVDLFLLDLIYGGMFSSISDNFSLNHIFLEYSY